MSFEWILTSDPIIIAVAWIVCAVIILAATYFELLRCIRDV